jgi:hypothetical protein
MIGIVYTQLYGLHLPSNTVCHSTRNNTKQHWIFFVVKLHHNFSTAQHLSAQGWFFVVAVVVVQYADFKG